MRQPMCHHSKVVNCKLEHPNCRKKKECWGHSVIVCFADATNRINTGHWSQQYACDEHLEYYVHEGSSVTKLRSIVDVQLP